MRARPYVCEHGREFKEPCRQCEADVLPAQYAEAQRLMAEAQRKLERIANLALEARKRPVYHLLDDMDAIHRIATGTERAEDGGDAG